MYLEENAADFIGHEGRTLIRRFATPSPSQGRLQNGRLAFEILSSINKFELLDDVKTVSQQKISTTKKPFANFLKKENEGFFVVQKIRINLTKPIDFLIELCYNHLCIGGLPKRTRIEYITHIMLFPSRW